VGDRRPREYGCPSQRRRRGGRLGRVAARYAGTIQAWGLWNEPNLTQFWSGTRQQFIDVVLKPGADAIHAANPSALVAGRSSRT